LETRRSAVYDREAREKALRLYEELGSARAASRALGGRPDPQAILDWADACAAGPRRRGIPLGVKLGTIGRVRGGMPYAQAAREVGVEPTTVLNWMRVYSERGEAGLMTRRELEERVSGGALPDDPDQLKRMVEELRLENDLMRAVLEVVKKDPRVDPGALTNREKTQVIDALRPDHSLTRLASRLRIPLSSYHYHHSRRREAGEDRLAWLRPLVRGSFERHHRRWGYRRIWAELRGSPHHVRVSEKLVRRVMREEGLQVPYARRRRRWSSYAGEVDAGAPNIPLREDGTHDFGARRPGELLVTDITEFRLPSGAKVYLSPVIDCFDGGLLSWSVGTAPTAELAASSLERALSGLPASSVPVVHSDRGMHYRTGLWKAVCEEHGAVRSMSRKGHTPDNARAEGFFGILKNEFFYWRDWSGVGTDQFISELEEWLLYYDEGRPKQSLGWRTPREYRDSLAVKA